jgi:putative ABC transport system substrate-binding protein
MRRRREVITMLGGAAAGWPLAARAQRGEPAKRIGMLNTFAADDAEGQARIAALHQALQPLGWTVGRTLRIEHRWGADAASIRKNATELVAFAPDVIVTSGVRTGRRSRWRRLRRQHGASGWQCDRVCGGRIRHEQQVA